MLTLELRFLEEEGFINRSFAEVPVKVEYSLTEDGKKLNGLVETLKEVGTWLKAR